MQLFKRKNTKLGNGIRSWNLPANKNICIGSTKLCSAGCYAKRGFFCFPNVIKSHERSLDISKQENFSSVITKEIQKTKKKVIRLHSKGDFYSVEYALKWLTVFKKCSDTEFYFYTRSWCDENILKVFDEMMTLPNVTVWFSYDKTSLPRPTDKKYCWAYLSENDKDFPTSGDLIFRIKRDTKLLKVNNIRVCPIESGLKIPKSLTCSSCKFCWSGVKRKRKNAAT